MRENNSDRGAFRMEREQGKKHIPATQAVVLNEGEAGRRSQSVASGVAGVLIISGTNPMV